MASCNPIKLAFNSFDPEGSASDKPPIIFLHRITSSKENWGDIPQKVANATKRKAYALDARNHGDSEWTDVIDYDCMEKDLLHFMDSMKIKKAIIIGHLMGGIIGIKTALKKPESVEKLVVENMHVKKFPQEHIDTILTCIRLGKSALQKVPLGTDEETAKKFIVDFICRNLPVELVAKVSNMKWNDIDLKRSDSGRYSFKFNVEAVENFLKNIAVTFPESKDVYKGPASFMYGAHSPYLVGKEDEYLNKFFPNAEFVEFPNATHKVHTDCPKEFTEALIKFILKE